MRGHRWVLILGVWLVAGLAALGAEAPQLDQYRVVYVHESHASLFNGPGGGLCMDEEVRPAHDECRRRYAPRTFPFPIRQLRRLTDVDARFGYIGLEAIGQDNQQWRLGRTEQNQIALYRVQNGQLSQSALTNLCLSDNSESHPRGVARTVHCGRDGVTWVLGTDRLYRFASSAMTELPLPVPKDMSQAGDFLGQYGSGAFWTHQMYEFGETLWIVRSFTSNCATPGSFILRVRDNRAEMMAWLPRRSVTGLVQHGKEVLALAPGRELLVFGQGNTRDAIKKRIAELDGDWATREAASRFLESLPLSDAEILRDALRTTRSPEQQLRLAAALERITATSTNLPAREVAGFRAGRLLFMDRQGRQYVQPWQDGKPQPKVVVFDGELTTGLRLPSAGWEFDCQGDDDRLYGHYNEAIHALDARRMAWQKLARLPGDGSLSNACVMATWRGRLCLGQKAQEGTPSLSVTRPIWFDLSAKHREPFLTGTVIAQDVPAREAMSYPVATGHGGLWFMRQQTRPVSNPGGWTNSVSLLQLNRAQNGKTVPVSTFLESDKYPNVWPVGPDAVIVATYGHCFFHDRGQTTAHRSLSELVAAHEVRLKELTDDAWMFTNIEDDEERLRLLRVGDTFYLEEKYREHQDGWLLARSALRRDGAWIEQHQQQRRADGSPERGYQPLLNRITAIDSARQRVLTFADNWMALRWVSLAGDGANTETLVQQPKQWAWYWLNQTTMPRFTKAWTLTPAAADRFASATPNPVGEAEYQSADLPNFRGWENGQWRETDVSLYGSDVWEDGNGGLWLFRVREAEVLFRDGRRQLIPLDAGTFLRYRLAIESPEAVWVTAEQSLTRFSLVRGQWTPVSVYRLPRFGEDFDGPWIVGDDVYYTVGAALHHTTLQELARAAARRRIGNWRNSPFVN